jgi:hypothetical protein
VSWSGPDEIDLGERKSNLIYKSLAVKDVVSQVKLKVVKLKVPTSISLLLAGINLRLKTV